MRIFPILCLVLVWLLQPVAVAAGGIDGAWEYSDSKGYFYLELHSDNSCLIVVGGPLEKHGGRCQYALTNGNLKIFAYEVNGQLISAPAPFQFTYDSQKDRITLTPLEKELARLSSKKEW